MKNLKRLLGLMAISGFAFGFAGNVKAEEMCSAQVAAGSAKFGVTLDDGAEGCYADLDGAVAALPQKGGTIYVLVEDAELNTSSSIKKNTTLNLNGKEAAIKTSEKIAVEDAALTITNGTINVDAAVAASFIEVKGGTKATALTVDKSVTINASETTAAVKPIKVTNTKDVTININGTWETSDELLDTSTAVGTGKVIVNANATKVTSNKGIATVDKKVITLNIASGEYIAKGTVAIIGNAGTINVGTKDATNDKVKITAEKAQVFALSGSTDRAKDLAVTIENGTFTSKTSNVIRFINSYKGTYAIKNGVFTSEGTDAEDKILPAIAITDWDFLKNHEGMITGGTFTNGVVGDVEVGTGINQPAKNATAILTKGSTITEGEGSVTVGTTGTTTTPGDQTQTPGDDTPDKNVQTYDGILSYVTLAISSLGALGFATKKVLF